MVLTRGFDNLKAGQRVHINGSLATALFKLEDGKTRNQILVRPSRTFVLDDQIKSKDTSTHDINQVDIVANVTKPATRMKNDSVVFIVATHFECK